MPIDPLGIHYPYGDYRILQTMQTVIDNQIKLRVQEEMSKMRNNYYYWHTPMTPMFITESLEEAKQKAEIREAKISSFKSKLDSLQKKKPKMIAKKHVMPDYTSTLTGWRGWKVNGNRLSALGSSSIWEAKKAESAKCNKTIGAVPHTTPSKDCTCGYWSFKTLDLFTEAAKDYIDSATVIGSVELWGRVIECENGFRSEFAYPRELWLLKDGLEFLSYDYGVPVRKL